MAMNTRAASGHGHLGAGPFMRAGKKIDEWVFTPPEGGKNCTVVVQMLRKDDRLLFTALSPSFAEPIEDSDIQRLREKVESWLQQDDMLRRGLVWEDWIEIVVEGYDREHQNQIGVSLTINRNILKRAVTATGDVVVLRTNNGHSFIRPFPQPKRVGEEDPIEGKGLLAGIGRRSVDHEYAYVPATTDNLAAIAAIQQGLVGVRQKVADFMHQSHKVGSLENINGSVPLLAANVD